MIEHWLRTELQHANRITPKDPYVQGRIRALKEALLQCQIEADKFNAQTFREKP